MALVIESPVPVPVVKSRVGKVPEIKAVILVVETLVEDALVTVIEVPVAFTNVRLLEDAVVTVMLVPVAFVKVKPWSEVVP